MDAVIEGSGTPCCLDEDVDHLLELHELLELHPELTKNPASRSKLEPPIDKSRSEKFDLCTSCFKAYSRNPLACEISVSIDFSAN